MHIVLIMLYTVDSIFLLFRHYIVILPVNAFILAKTFVC